MTQTGGLVILSAWSIFVAILAVLAYVLLRTEKDPLQEISAATVDKPDQANTTPSAESQPGTSGNGDG
jgi:hypothetical protein